MSKEFTLPELRSFRAKHILKNYNDRITPRARTVLTAMAEKVPYYVLAMDLGSTENALKKMVHNQFTRFKVNEAMPGDQLEAEEPKVPCRKRVESKRDARRAEVKHLHGQGLTSAEIASQLGKARSTIQEDLKVLDLTPNTSDPNDQFGWLTGPEARRISDLTERRVIERRLARGMTVGEMALTDGRHRENILHDMERLGIPIPEGERWINLFGSGKRVPYVSKKFRK